MINSNTHTLTQVPLHMIPSFNAHVAAERGVLKSLMFRTWGGIGDVICAEPTIRFALETFRDCEISLATLYPEFFQHLKFKDVFNLNREQPIWEKYFTMHTLKETSDLSFEFMSHMQMNCIDCASQTAFRTQLPIASKEICLKPTAEEFECVELFAGSRKRRVVLHPGKHWQTKTFPKDWWDDVIMQLQARDIVPILIGREIEAHQGTVDVNPEGCLDLRGKLTHMESVALLQSSQVLITNDSAPLHMAASGRAWIGFIATAKHHDFITHWRNGQWSWRMKSLGKGGYWDIVNFCPNKTSEVSAEFVEPAILRSWLPEPSEVVEWAHARAEEMLNEHA